MFKKVDSRVDFIKLEHEILDFWEKNKIFQKLQEKNKGHKSWSFLDGPITANNPMGVHHAWGRTYKDLYQRYKAMQGFDQRFQNGFDCQGLWVEVEVEKELGFKTKKDIEKYGVDKFVEKCKERVKKYSKIQTQQSIRLGQWMDWDNSYYTMSDENNFAIWHFLKKCWTDGNIYKGHDVVPWCPRCETAISQHEMLTEDYKQITHDAIFIEYPINEKKNSYLIAWTTTPWTLPGNVAVAVDEKKDYVETTGETAGNKYYLNKEAAERLNLTVVRTFKGKELVGLTYRSPFDELFLVKKALEGYTHRVVATDDQILPISEADGTGIVHIAPGQGTEDYQLGKKLKLPAVNLIDASATYLDNFGDFSGKNAKKHPELIIEYLKNNDRLFKTEKYTHRYPACWRCKAELVWRIADEWYINMDNKYGAEGLSMRQRMQEITKKIKWMPEFGLDQELDWLKNMHDWLISKKRYWGLALPIYKCVCGNFEVIGSKEELEKRAVEGWEEFKNHSPHKPWIDKVKIKCSKCGKVVSRIPDVGNPWLDAGIVPYSTMKYFSDKEYWKKWFPADFICESFPGQFKNWFYSLIAMSAVLEDTNPFERVLGYATVRDERGEEMHKSKGNAIWFDDAAEKMGVDVMRWMYASANPFKNLSFGYTIAEKIRRKLILFWNVYSFFVLYANIDKWNYELRIKNYELRNKLDKWILSELNTLILEANKELDKFNVMRVMENMEKFLDNLANWYVRRSRRRFWKSESDEDKKQAYRALYIVLVEFVKLLAPILPFVSEEIYLNLRSGIIRDEKGLLGNLRESVHLCDYPKANLDLIDEKLNQEMNLVRVMANLGLGARAKAKMKVRQPLSKLKVKSLKLKVDDELLEILKDEVNIKEVEFVDEINFETQEVKGKKKYISGEKGFEVESDGNVVVALQIELTEDLKLEGMAREIVRHIQSMRKEADYQIADRIKVCYFSASKNLNKVFVQFGDYIKKETLATELIDKKEEVDLGKEVKVGGKMMWVGVMK